MRMAFPFVIALRNELLTSDPSNGIDMAFPISRLMSDASSPLIMDRLISGVEIPSGISFGFPVG